VNFVLTEVGSDLKAVVLIVLGIIQQKKTLEELEA